MESKEEENGIGDNISWIASILRYATRKENIRQTLSVGEIQRVFSRGFGRTLRILDVLERAGYINIDQDEKGFSVLITAEQVEQLSDDYLKQLEKETENEDLDVERIKHVVALNSANQISSAMQALERAISIRDTIEDNRKKLEQIKRECEAVAGKKATGLAADSDIVRKFFTDAEARQIELVVSRKVNPMETVFNTIEKTQEKYKYKHYTGVFAKIKSAKDKGKTEFLQSSLTKLKNWYEYFYKNNSQEEKQRLFEARLEELTEIKGSITKALKDMSQCMTGLGYGGSHTEEKIYDDINYNRPVFYYDFNKSIKEDFGGSFEYLEDIRDVLTNKRAGSLGMAIRVAYKDRVAAARRYAERLRKEKDEADREEEMYLLRKIADQTKRRYY